MSHPVPGPIGTPYGKPGPLWSLKYHTGVDFPVASGTVVVAPAPGRIVHAGWGGWGQAYGLHIIGESKIGGVVYRWMTAHLSREEVTVGQTIKQGDRIGLSGNTGNTSGPHVHFETRRSPYGFRSSDILNPAVVLDYSDNPPAAVTKDTIFDVVWWSQAAERYFGKPWLPRVPGIGKTIRGVASVYGFSELYTNADALSILNQLNSSANVDGTNFKRCHRDDTAQNGGPAGLEIMYNADVWMLQRQPVAYASGVQNRWAFVAHLIRRDTGQHVAFLAFHGPVFYNSLKEKYGAWLGRLIGQIDGPVVPFGDTNRISNSNSPRKEIQDRGYRTVEQQVAQVNESADEFPGEGDLADIWTIPTVAPIISGKLTLTDPALDDHRMQSARVKVPKP